MELVDILVEFENSWSQGLTYFLDSKKLSQLLHFSQVIEATAEKHKQFADQLEQRDAEIFLNLPGLLILKSLENDDKEICSIFYPDMDDNETDKGRQVASLRLLYDKMRRKQGSYELYNLLEKCVIEVPLSESETKTFKELDLEYTMIREIRGLAMQLSRFKPADWNKFLDVVIK